MNEFERKLYLKYRKYDAIIMPQVISIKTFYTSKRTSFFKKNLVYILIVYILLFNKEIYKWPYLYIKT